MCLFEGLKMCRFWVSFWLVEIWNGAFWLVVRLLPPGAPRYNPILSLKCADFGVSIWLVESSFTTRSPLKHCFAVILSPGGATGQVCRRLWLVDSSFTTRGRNVSSPIIAPEALFCGNIVARGRYGSSVLTVLIGREQSRDLWRHSSSFAYHVTSLWRLPSCFAAMLFRDDTVTRRRCYNVTVPHLHITWPLYGGRHLVLLPCCFAMIRSPEGAATSQLTFWWVESRHVTYDVTAPPLLSKMRRFWGTVLRWHDRQGTLQVKVKGRWRAFWLVESPMTSPHQVWIKLSVRVRVSNPNRKFQKKTKNL